MIRIPRLSRSVVRAAVLIAVLPLTAYASIHHALPATAAASTYDWLQFNGDSQHSGNNTQETTITRGNVARLQPLFQTTLPSPADGAPVYLHGISTANGVRDLLFVTTKAGHILALDAHTGIVVWSHQYPAGTCRVAGGSDPCFTTSSPAIDPNRQYVYSYGLDGYVHKHRVTDGTELTGGGWPALATRKPSVEKGSSALTIATATNGASYLYVANGGYPGDAGDYQGHVTTINLNTGTQHVFNAACSNRSDVHFVFPPNTPNCAIVQSAVWARAGVVYDRDTNRIYFATGNGSYSLARRTWGDSVLAIFPNGAGFFGFPVDSYTPIDSGLLQLFDLDLGSTAPAILPTPATSTVRHLGLQSGKDGKLRLLNLGNLSGRGGSGHIGGEIGPIIAVPQGGEVLTAPAVWINPADGHTWVFVANDNGISGLQLTVDTNGTPRLQAKWQTDSGGTSPIVANGVLYQVRSLVIEARDPITGVLLWRQSSGGRVHWSSPIVANGVVYTADNDNHLVAFSVDGVNISGDPQASR